MTSTVLTKDKIYWVDWSQVQEDAINWALDCFENYMTEGEDIQEEMESWESDRLIRWLDKVYDGGFNQFMKDGDIN